MTKVYVLSLENEPIHVYSKEETLFEECRRWFREHESSWSVENSFYHWAEDRGYSNDDIDQAWCDFINWNYENGEWGNYSWVESTLD